MLAQGEPVPTHWLDYIERGGVLAAVLVFAWLLYTRRIVTREEHLERLAEERRYTEEWKGLARSTLERIDDAVTAIREKV